MKPEKTGDLEPQGAVLKDRVIHLTQLLARLRAQRLHQRLHLRHLPLQVLEQLVEVVDARREHVAKALHEAVEVRGPALHPLLQHLVQLAHHVADAAEVLALHLLQGPLDALEHLVEHLLLQLLHELLELLPRLVVDELVVAQALDPAAEVVGQAIELVVALARDPVEQLARLRRSLLQPAFDALSFGVDDVLDFLAKLLDRRVEVVAAELALTGLPELLEQLLEAAHVRRTPAQEALQGGVQVAVVHEVVGQGVQDVSGVEFVELLSSVPAGVPKPHPTTLAGRQPPSERSMALAAFSAIAS